MATILVVDDERPIVRVVKDKLHEEGFAVLEAYDGREGLSVALDAHPDLILLDLVMPVMDGAAMLDELKKDAWGTHVPVIILTNSSSEQEKALQRDYDYLVKSDWKLHDVVEKIRERLTG